MRAYFSSVSSFLICDISTPYVRHRLPFVETEFAKGGLTYGIFDTSSKEAMKSIVITAIILVSVCFRQGGALNNQKTEDVKVHEGVRSVYLGLYFLYDAETRRKWGTYGVASDINGYLDLVVKTAQIVHFQNVTCTNITLYYMGAREVSTSSGIDVFAYSDVLNANATLEALSNYSSVHRDEFGRPDLTVYITGHELVNVTDFCKSFGNRREKYEDPGYKAYCMLYKGAAYYGRMCGNYSVAIIEDKGIMISGATPLAQQIAKQMGVGPDNLRNRSECPNKDGYFTSGGWRNNYQVKHPDISECGKSELIEYIDGMSDTGDVCWNDVPNVTIPEYNKLPDTPLDSADLCKWRNSAWFKCNSTSKADGSSTSCRQTCCEMSTTCPGEHQDESKCETRKGIVYHDGKSCREKGVCFENKCHDY